MDEDFATGTHHAAKFQSPFRPYQFTFLYGQISDYPRASFLSNSFKIKIDGRLSTHIVKIGALLKFHTPSMIDILILLFLRTPFRRDFTRALAGVPSEQVFSTNYSILTG